MSICFQVDGVALTLLLFFFYTQCTYQN